MNFRDTTAWVFDLDNTLYPASADLFGQMEPLMTRFITEALRVSVPDADQIRRETWERYGATLTGLIVEYGVDPAEFLEATHQLDLSVLEPAPELAAAIARLPGPCVIHTNGPRDHAERVLEARGLTGVFDQVVAIEDTGHIPKPDPRSTEAFLAKTLIKPSGAVMFEDHVNNLIEPARLGMTTVWVTEQAGDIPDHVGHRIRDLAEFLGSVIS